MEQVFASLSKRQTMLLLTTLSFGGSEGVESFQHLIPEEEELLKFRAQTLLQIPREKRVPLLVQEIKRLITQRKRQLGGADAKELSALLKGERTAMVEVVLRALPVELADAVRQGVGPRRPVKLNREVKPDILSIIRWKIEDGLRHRAPNAGTFRFTDLMTLQQRELLAVCDRMGARVLSSAIAGMATPARDAFLAKLPPDQRTLAVRAAEAAGARKLSEDDARTVLEIHGATENPSLGMRSAGVQRIVRAAVAQSVEFATRLADRHPGELGKLIVRWLRDEKNRPVKGDGGRADIVEQLERLAQRGIIDKPMRLPPPMRMPPKPQMPPRTSNQPALQQEARRQLRPGPGSAGEHSADERRSDSQRLKPISGPRPDTRPLRTGSASQVMQPLPERRPVAGKPPRPTSGVLREGKPLSHPSVPAVRRATTSPATQDVPRRKPAPSVGVSKPVGRPKRGS